MSNRVDFWLYKERVDSVTCARTVRQAEKIGFHDAAVGDGVTRINKDVRDCGTAFLPRMHPIECILMAHAMDANVSLDWNLILLCAFECTQIARYSANGKQFYDMHVDLNRDLMKPGMERKMTAVLLLSDPKTYAGGDLVIGTQTVLEKGIGTIVVFPSFLPHRVTPVTKGTRYTATCWVSGPWFK